MQYGRHRNGSGYLWSEAKMKRYMAVRQAVEKATALLQKL
jgi:hypothetical protein